MGFPDIIYFKITSTVQATVELEKGKSTPRIMARLLHVICNAKALSAEQKKRNRQTTNLCVYLVHNIETKR